MGPDTALFQRQISAGDNQKHNWRNQGTLYRILQCIIQGGSGRENQAPER